MKTSSPIPALLSLVGLQLFSRAFTFILNHALLRIASPEAFGTASIQFELLLSTILFLSRQGIRNALLQCPPSRSRNPLVTNIATLPIIIGVPVAALATGIYRYVSSQGTRDQPHFDLGIAIYTLAAFAELLSEPLYIRAQNDLRLGVRVRAEGFAVVSKTVATLGALFVLGDTWSLVAFALGQAAFGSTVLAVFLWEYFGSLSFLPKRVAGANKNTSYFDGPLLRLSLEMTLQSLVKHFLTEADRLVVSRFSPLKDQGGYAIATNYGSLVARIIFQPIEETSRLFFSKSLAADVSTDNKTSTDATLSSLNILHSLLLLYTHFSLLLLAFLPPYTRTLMRFLLPPRYLSTSAPRVFAAYAVYLPVMAVNGVLEAVVSAVVGTAGVRSQARWMGIASGVFIAVAVVLGRYGGERGGRETGLVYANAAAAACRAAWGWVFVKGSFKKRGAQMTVRKVVPPASVVVVSVVVGLVVRWSETTYGGAGELKDMATHIAVGVSCLVAWGTTCFLTEWEALFELRNAVRQSPSRSLVDDKQD